jgi:cytochrome b561
LLKNEFTITYKNMHANSLWKAITIHMRGDILVVIAAVILWLLLPKSPPSPAPPPPSPTASTLARAKHILKCTMLDLIVTAEKEKKKANKDMCLSSAVQCEVA